MNLDSASYAAPLGKLQAMWFSPAFSGPFFGRFYLFPLSASEALGSFFISIWVFLLVGLVIAFAISFFFCGYTLIYLLLRRDVDATEMEEVYVEDFESMPTLKEEAEKEQKPQEQKPDETEASEPISQEQKQQVDESPQQDEKVQEASVESSSEVEGEKDEQEEETPRADNVSGDDVESSSNGEEDIDKNNDKNDENAT